MTTIFVRQLTRPGRKTIHGTATHKLRIPGFRGVYACSLDHALMIAANYYAGPGVKPIVRTFDLTAIREGRRGSAA